MLSVREFNTMVKGTATRFHVQPRHASAFRTLFLTYMVLYCLDGSFKSHMEGLEPSTKGLYGAVDHVLQSLLGPLPLVMRELGSRSIPADEFAKEVEELKRLCDDCWRSLQVREEDPACSGSTSLSLKKTHKCRTT